MPRHPSTSSQHRSNKSAGTFPHVLIAAILRRNAESLKESARSGQREKQPSLGWFGVLIFGGNSEEFLRGRGDDQRMCLAGSRTASAKSARNGAARAPAITRWSQDNVKARMGRM